MSQFCDCTKDGWCDRYGREMNGRFREICQGKNCDLGTAAAFRLQWASEAPPKGTTSTTPIPLLLKANQNPGDLVALTAAIYSLHKAHPGKYATAVESDYPEIFEYNPDVVKGTWGWPSEVQMHYPAIHDSNHRGIHFMEAWCEFLSFALNESVPLLTNRPHLYFPQEEEQVIGDYWVVCSGGKKDFTNKLWSQLNYQKVVSMLAKDIGFIQVGEKFEDHPYLRGTNVTDQINCTTLRQLFNLVRRSRGVLCGVSLLMHVAAALGKPAIIIAGGREPVSWNCYPKQHYLHSVGMLPCSDPQGYIGGACWRSRTVPLGDNEVLDKDPCLFPQENLPKCMSLIDPAYVADLILKIDQSYNDVGNHGRTALPLRLPLVQ